MLTNRAGKFQPILGGRYMSKVYEINCWTLNFLTDVYFTDLTKY